MCSPCVLKLLKSDGCVVIPHPFTGEGQPCDGLSLHRAYYILPASSLRQRYFGSMSLFACQNLYQSASPANVANQLSMSHFLKRTFPATFMKGIGCVCFSRDRSRVRL